MLKQRYGGPFTTSDVEDVKTLIRVFLDDLIHRTNVCYCCTDLLIIIFATFAIHTGTEYMIGHGNCSADWILLQSGLLSEIVSTLIMPLYTWLLFSVLYRKKPASKDCSSYSVCCLTVLFNSSKHACCGSHGTYC